MNKYAQWLLPLLSASTLLSSSAQATDINKDRCDLNDIRDWWQSDHHQTPPELNFPEDAQSCATPAAYQAGRFALLGHSLQAPGPLPGGNVSMAVSQRSDYWDIGETLEVCFYPDHEELRGLVASYAKSWEAYANIHLHFDMDHDCGETGSDIRVAIADVDAQKADTSSWSLIGRASRYKSEMGGRTMNLGWMASPFTSAEKKRSTVIHEFGHAIGLQHEQQNPAINIPFDKFQTYAYFARYDGWCPNVTYSNVLAPLTSRSVEYTEWDRKSIMQYAIDPSITVDHSGVRENYELSNGDKLWATLVYPPAGLTRDAMWQRYRAFSAANKRMPTREEILQDPTTPAAPALAASAFHVETRLGQSKIIDDVEYKEFRFVLVADPAALGQVAKVEMIGRSSDNQPVVTVVDRATYLANGEFTTALGMTRFTGWSTFGARVYLTSGEVLTLDTGARVDWQRAVAKTYDASEFKVEARLGASQMLDGVEYKEYRFVLDTAKAALAQVTKVEVISRSTDNKPVITTIELGTYQAKGEFTTSTGLTRFTGWSTFGARVYLANGQILELEGARVDWQKAPAATLKLSYDGSTGMHSHSISVQGLNIETVSRVGLLQEAVRPATTTCTGKLSPETYSILVGLLHDLASVPAKSRQTDRLKSNVGTGGSHLGFELNGLTWSTESGTEFTTTEPLAAKVVDTLNKAQVLGEVCTTI